MKSRLRLQSLGFQFLFLLSGFVVTSATAIVGDNPYRPIVDRNVFALKPPTPVVTTLTQPPTPPAGVELRGISTLLGRPQVLLNIKVPAKPPEQPKDRSLVLDVGQREGEVEVLEINPASGSVRLRNQGNELTMNLKDNAVKPQFSASSPTAPALPMPGINPTQPTASGVPRPVNTGVTLPTRQLRSDSSPSTSVGGVGSNQSLTAAGNRTPVENAALYSVSQTRNEELRQAGVKVPRLPKHPLLNNPTDQ